MKYELWNKNLHGYSSTNLFMFIDICHFSLLFVMHIWEGEMKNKIGKGTAEKNKASYRKKTKREKKANEKRKEKLKKWQEKNE